MATHPYDRRSGIPDRIWYAAYGSNTNPQRLNCYAMGTAPPGATEYAAGPLAGGWRDRASPVCSAGLVLPGLLYFASESAIWTGGCAFYDPSTLSGTAVRVYLLSRAQFSDLVAQEMYRSPGTDLDLTEVLRAGSSRLGPGRYETLVCPGTYAGIPVMTCTAPWRWRDLSGNPPAAAYLRHIATGLRDAHRWSLRETAGYLASRPGADTHWTPQALARVLRAGTNI